MLRRRFLQTLVGGSSLLVVAACGDDGAATPLDAAPSCSERGAICVISGNHGHSMIVTKDEINAPADREYDITGGADHTHTAMVASAQFETLATNAPVSVTSSVAQGHSHTISIRCK